MGLESLFLAHASQAIEKEFGVRVPFGELVETHSSLDSLAKHLDSARPQAQTGSVKLPETPCSPATGMDRVDGTTVKLTEAQREIWYETERSEEASSVFNETCWIELNGDLNTCALERAVQAIVDRHEALRTGIDREGITQTILPRVEASVSRVDFGHLKTDERQRELNNLLAKEAGTPFDLSKPPLIRFNLVRLAPQSHLLAFTVHHIICDGGSINVIVRELAELYSAESCGTTVRLGAVHGFSEFAREHEAELASAERKAAERYWTAEFQTPISELELPQDLPRPSSKAFRAGQLQRHIGMKLTEDLKSVSGQHGATLFTTLLSVYCVLLHRLTGQQNLAVGIPTSGRGITFSDELVGHCVNFLPMRLRVAPEAPFSEHLAQVRRKFMQAYEHQCYTFGSLVQKLALPRVPNRMPLLSATFNLERKQTGAKFAGLVTRVRGNYSVFTNVDLTFDLLEEDGEILVECTYCADTFRPETIARWLGHFETLLRGIVTAPAETVAELPLLDEAAWRQIVYDWNRTVLDYPKEAKIHELFEAQADRTPDKVALVVGQQQITYRELNRQANQLAHHLRSVGAGPEVLIGLCVERGTGLIIAALGILKAGAAYLPLDWRYPAERLRFMIEDSSAPILIAQEALRERLPTTKAKVVVLDRDWEPIGRAPATNPVRTGTATDIAYVMYTSGSTGRAKGVAIEHRSTVSFLHWARDVFRPEELAGVLASTSICFDLSIFEVFVPLSWGGTVIIAENAAEIPALPTGYQITLINTVPSAIKDLLETNAIPASVTVVNLAGEKLSGGLVQQLYALPHIRKVYDLYGPSEATTYATFALRRANGPPTVGRPIANTQVYILDRLMRPCPVGVTGELYIGGDGLARGYINNLELTAENFVANPFSRTGSARLYRTGDMARYSPDGNIEFVGRGDYQVKLRGYRIELGEIESVLSEHPSVRGCVAALREDRPDEKHIAAYVVGAAGLELSGIDLRRFMRERLPDYMIPSVFVQVEALPLMPNGKVDRSKLPGPGPAIVLAEKNVQQAPLTPVEEALIEIWRDVLGVQAISLHDDFFDLGGHSVLVGQITSRVREVFQVELSLRHMFGAPTVAALAQVIEKLLAQEAAATTGDQAQTLVAKATEREAL